MNVALSPGARTLSLSAVMLHMLGVGLTLGLTYPLTAVTLQSWGSPGWIVGLAGSMSPLAILLVMPVLPRIAARLGAVPAMLTGCLVGAAGLAVMYALPHAWAWVGARFIIGAGLALPWLVGDVWINAIAPDASRGRIIALYVTSLFAGFALGPVALDAIGTAGPWPFVLGGGALVLAAVPLVLVARHAPSVQAEPGGNILAAARSFPLVALGALLAGFTEALIFSLLTVWGLAVGLGVTGSLWLLTICILGGVLLQPALGLVADRIERRGLLGWSGIGLILAASGLHLAEGHGVYAAAFLLGGLILGLYALALTILGEQCRPEQLAHASAAFLVLYQAGSLAGPLLAGAAMDAAGAAGFVAPLALSGLVMAVAARALGR